MGTYVIEGSESNWESEVVASPLPVLVDFWAHWCGPCRMLEPTVDAVAYKYANRVKVVKINVDENQALAEKFAVRSIPRLVLLKDGVVVTNVSGRSLTPIADELDSHLG